MKNTYLIISAILVLTFVVTYFIGIKSNVTFTKQDKKGMPFWYLVPSGIALSKIPVAKLLSVVAKDSIHKIVSNKQRFASIVYGKSKQMNYNKIYSALAWVYFMVGVLVTSILSFVASLTNDVDDVKLFTFGIIVSLVISAFPYNKLKEKASKKQFQISMEFPIFANKVMLLINAGMTVSAAWKIASLDSKDREHPLYQELNNINSEIAGGLNEVSALDSFAKRMGIKEITRCINYICLNLKKGGSDVVTSLNDVVNECFENKKTVAKRKGEKASTSMTFPMILTLIAIILAIGAPAYLSLGGSIV
jgi:tight adherence protein C